MSVRRIYGYGIVDRHNKPFEGVFYTNRKAVVEEVDALNDDDGLECDSPYRVVKLFWILTPKRKRK